MRFRPRRRTGTDELNDVTSVVNYGDGGASLRVQSKSGLGNFAGSTAAVSQYAPWGAFSLIGVDVYNRNDRSWVATPQDKLGPFWTWHQAHTPNMPWFVGELGIDARHSGAAQWTTSVWSWIKSHGSAQFVNWNVKKPYGPQTSSTLSAWTNIAP